MRSFLNHFCIGLVAALSFSSLFVCYSEPVPMEIDYEIFAFSGPVPMEVDYEAAGESEYEQQSTSAEVGVPLPSAHFIPEAELLNAETHEESWQAPATNVMVDDVQGVAEGNRGQTQRGQTQSEIGEENYKMFEKILFEYSYHGEPKSAKDYYKILNLAHYVSRTQVKKAYRKLALKWHPDKNPNRKEIAEAIFKLITQAYEVLQDEAHVQVYNRELKRFYEEYGESQPVERDARSEQAQEMGKTAESEQFDVRGYAQEENNNYCADDNHEETQKSEKTAKSRTCEQRFCEIVQKMPQFVGLLGRYKGLLALVAFCMAAPFSF